MKKRTQKGFTLIELMIAIVILALLSATGVNIFYRSIRGTSQIELRKALDDGSRLIIATLGRFIRESKIVSLDGATKDDCVANGQTTGSSLVVRSLDDLESTLSLSNGQVSSVSAGGTIIFNPDPTYTVGLVGSTPFYTWYCANGVADRILVNFRGNSISTEGEVTATRDYSIDLILRNSGQ